MTTSKMGLRRRDILKGAAGLAAAGLIGAPMVARAQQKFICRMGHSEAIGSPLTDAFANWTKVLNEKSGGRIDAQHFPASQLGSYTQNIEQNRLGTIQVTTGGPDTEEVMAPEIDLYGRSAVVGRAAARDVARYRTTVVRDAGYARRRGRDGVDNNAKVGRSTDHAIDVGNPRESV
jgi:hypothetical protein